MGTVNTIYSSLLLAIIGFCAQAEFIEASDLNGYFTFQSVSGTSFIAQVQIHEAGTYSYREQMSDLPATPEPGCSGTYEVIDSQFEGELNCSVMSPGLPLFSQKINFSEVRLNDLESRGVVLEVYSSAFELAGLPATQKFLVKKRTDSVFAESSTRYEGKVQIGADLCS